jgi:hypothetical protein
LKASEKSISFLVPKITSRVQYISKYILEERLGLDVILSTNPLEGIRLLEHGTDKIFEDSFYVPSNGMLFEDGLRWKTKVSGHGKSVVFPVHDKANADIDFDIFSGIFYLLSRFEEYQSPNKDEFGRFPFTDSFADRYGFISYPLVDIWVDLLRSKLSQHYPELELKPNIPSTVAPTIDIDAAFYYQNRPFLNHVISIIGSIIRFNPNAITKRIATVFGNKADPYDTHAYIIDLIKQEKFTDIKTFFLMGNIHSSMDRPGMIKESAFVSKCLNLWKSIGQVGIHPSYRSNSHPGWMDKEKDKLEKMVGEPITISRQHFLKISLPKTYRALLDAGIMADYSMSFPDTIGFRAGTAYSFPWYDLEREEITSLRLFPPAAMEITLRDYMNCNPEEAKAKIDEIWSNMKDTGGKFSFIWHNSSWPGCEGWDGWDEVFKHILTLN